MQQEDARRSDQEELRQNKQPQQQPQPQKCPRCDSLDTKFCYYNNYSLSQPRYFCKTCRRYWTHGGTLRNVPVGGGCRKGKRAKTSSFATTSSGTTASTTNSTSNIAPIAGGGALRTNKETVENSVGPTPHPPTGFSPMGFGSFSYPATGGGGFLSSLAAIQSFTHPGVGGINLGGDLGGRSTGGSSSDLGLLMHGFNSNVPPLLAPPQFRSQLQCQQSITRQFYHLGGDGDGNANSKSTSSITTTSLVGQGPPAFSYPQEDSLIQSRGAPVAVSTAEASSSSHQQLLNWPHHQGFTYPNISDIYLWSTSTTTNTTTGTTTTSSPVGSSSMNPNQWHDLPGYDPPR